MIKKYIFITKKGKPKNINMQDQNNGSNFCINLRTSFLSATISGIYSLF